MPNTKHPECPNDQPHLLHQITVGNGLQVICKGLDPEDETPRLSQAGSAAVRRAFANMPYAAHPRVMKGPIAMGSYRDGLSEAALVEALENLASVLREHADRNRQIEEEHRALKADVRAFRRVLGTDGIGSEENL